MNKHGEAVTGVIIVMLLFTAFGVFFGSKHQAYVDSKPMTVITP